MAGARRAKPGWRRWACAIGAGGAGVLLAASPALPGSSSVSGRLSSEAVTGPACESPVGICTRGTLKGSLKGTFTFAAAGVTATVDTPSTGVVTYIGDLEIVTKAGTLICDDAGALATGGERSTASVCTVTGGTGAFAGASGRLRIAGTSPDFDAPGQASGSAAYEGTVDVP